MKNDKVVIGEPRIFESRFKFWYGTEIISQVYWKLHRDKYGKTRIFMHTQGFYRRRPQLAWLKYLKFVPESVWEMTMLNETSYYNCNYERDNKSGGYYENILEAISPSDSNKRKGD